MNPSFKELSKTINLLCEKLNKIVNLSFKDIKLNLPFKDKLNPPFNLDSNLGPLDLESDSLPIEPIKHGFVMVIS